MKKFRIIFIICLIVVGSYLAGKLIIDNQSEEVRGNISIWANEDSYDYLNEASKLFIESNEKCSIDVSLVYRKNYKDKILSDSENLPNIIQLSTNTYKSIVDNGEFKNYISEERTIVENYSSNFSKGRLKEVDDKNKIIGVPLTSRPLALYLREDMLSEYGYTHEDINTWDDLKRVGEDILEKSSGKIKILNAVGQDYEDLVSLLVMQAMEESDDRVKIEEFVSTNLSALSNIMNTSKNGEFLARISSINSMKELSALDVFCEWTANNAPAKSNGANRFYVAEGDNLLVLNESEENSDLIKKFIGFLATNTEETVKYVKEGRFFSSYLSVYKNISIEDEVKNFKGKSPLVVMSNIYEKAPKIENYTMYLEMKNKMLSQ